MQKLTPCGYPYGVFFIWGIRNFVRRNNPKDRHGIRIVMNYMTEIKLFYERLETYPLSSAAIALWHALMFTANRCGWAEEFSASLGLLMVAHADFSLDALPHAARIATSGSYFVPRARRFRRQHLCDPLFGAGFRIPNRIPCRDANRIPPRFHVPHCVPHGDTTL